MQFTARFSHRITAFTVFVFAVLLCGSQAFAAARPGDQDVVIQSSGKQPPKLVFACDRPTSQLAALFTPQLIADLKELNAGIALSTEDFSPARAQIVQQLNAAGIPMTAWIVLPKEQGYYVNASNPQQTSERFAEFDKWTAANGLRWEAVGLDIEPNFSEFADFHGHKLKLAWMVLKRAFNAGRVQRARESYAALIAKMHSHGYSVQTYQLEFIVPERKAHSTLLERIFGVVDVRGDDEALMLYSSFNHKVGAGVIWQFGPDAQTVAVGSTAPSGDPATDKQFPPLNWDEFSRDLLVAHHFSSLIGIYSLEGCVQQGFIPRLKTMDWNQTVVIPASSVKDAYHFARGIQSILWIGSHLLYFIAIFLLVAIWLVRMFVNRRRRKRAARAANLESASAAP
jgi:hypothetical protein